MEHAARERDSLGIEISASRQFFGELINLLWGDRVKKVKRGQRIDRKAYVLNLTRKQGQTVQPPDYDVTNDFEQLAKDDTFMLPTGWFRVVDNPCRICFIHPEPWEFGNQRIYKEIVMELSPEKNVSYSVKSRSCELHLSTLNIERIIKELTVHEQAKLVLDFIDTSKLCLGCSLSDDDSSVSPILHQTGVLKSLNNSEVPMQNRAFSSKCQLFVCHAGKPCSKCTGVSLSYKKRKCRREARESIHKHCNKRYLTKDEILQQLQEQRKLNRKHDQEKEGDQNSGSEDEKSNSNSDSGNEEEKE